MRVDISRASLGASRMRELVVVAVVLLVGYAREPTPSREAKVFDAPVPVEVPAVVESPKAKAAELQAQEPPPDFVVLAEAVPGAVLEVRYATADNFTGAPLPGYTQDTLWVHQHTGAALAKVQASLAEAGLRLRVYDAYRPARASAAMVAWAQASGREDLIRGGYVARHSNHARGNTVDVTLESMDGEPLDMGSAWDTFSAQSHYASARGDAKGHRRTLRHEMMRAGFRPYDREWWHFTLPEPAGLPRLDVPYSGPRGRWDDASARHRERDVSQTEPR